MARLRSCKYCGRIHAMDYDCGKKPVRKAKEPNEVTRLRTCRRWGKARQAARERDHHLCRVCFAQGVIQCEGLEVHHIVPLAEDGEQAYELDNLITLCTYHHKQADRGEISREGLLALAADDPGIPPGGAP